MAELTNNCRAIKSGQVTIEEAWRSLDYASELLCDVLGWFLVGSLGPDLGEILAGPGALHILDSSNLPLTQRIGTLTPEDAQIVGAFAACYPNPTPN